MDYAGLVFEDQDKMEIYEIIKGIYKKTPDPIRKSKHLAGLINSLLPHDMVYSATYYEYVDEAAMRSAGKICGSIIREFSPKSVIDVGCGTCDLLKKLQDQGC